MGRQSQQDSAQYRVNGGVHGGAHRALGGPGHHRLHVPLLPLMLHLRARLHLVAAAGTAEHRVVLFVHAMEGGLVGKGLIGRVGGTRVEG